MFDQTDETPKACRHSWVAGMMYVSDEDVASVAEERAAKGIRPVECETCEKVYAPGDEDN